MTTAYKVECQTSGGWCFGSAHETKAQAEAASRVDYDDYTQTRVVRFNVPDGCAVINGTVGNVADYAQRVEQLIADGQATRATDPTR